MINEPWIFGWNAVGVITSAILSALLIGFTVWIAWRQNQMQKQIADRDIKAQNYQHRIRCYLQMIKSFEALSKTHGFCMGHLYQGTPMPVVAFNDMDNGAWTMFAVKKEAQLLFGEELAKRIAEIYEYYAEYSQQFRLFYVLNPQLHNQLKNIDFDKFMNAHRDTETLQEIKKISAPLASLIRLHCVAQDKFKDQEFNNLILSETKVE
jgi:hypothetical protein